MDETLGRRRSVFDSILALWEEGDTLPMLTLVAANYQGNMLHLKDGERTAKMCPDWIQNYRDTYPGTLFTVYDQVSVDDRLWTRLSAHRGDRAVANGMNRCRFEGELIAEEWAIWSSWVESDGSIAE
jgi:hypothetical protein